MIYTLYYHHKILENNNLTFTYRYKKGRMDFSILP